MLIVKLNKRAGFVLVEALVGLVIVTTTTVTYLTIHQLMSEQERQSIRNLTQTRKRFEECLLKDGVSSHHE